MSAKSMTKFSSLQEDSGIVKVMIHTRSGKDLNCFVEKNTKIPSSNDTNDSVTVLMDPGCGYGKAVVFIDSIEYMLIK